MSILPKSMLDRQEKAVSLSKKFRDFFKVMISPRWANSKYELTFTDLTLEEAEALLVYLKRCRSSEVILIGKENE
jgi:hypothetical protein